MPRKTRVRMLDILWLRRAGVLQVQLDEVGHYTARRSERVVTAKRVRQAEVMTWWVGGCTFILITILKYLEGILLDS